jgi:hypothetical protein
MSHYLVATYTPTHPLLGYMLAYLLTTCWYKLIHQKLSANAQILYHYSTSPRVTQFYIEPKGMEVRITKSLT